MAYIRDIHYLFYFKSIVMKNPSQYIGKNIGS